MAKIHKLTKGGQTIYPATTTDAVVNPNTRKSLTAELSKLESYSVHSRRVFRDDAQYVPVNLNGNGGTKKELNNIFKAIYVSKKIEGLYLERYYDNQIFFKDNSGNAYGFSASMEQSQDANIIISKTTADITFVIIYNPGKRINGGFYNSNYDKTGLSDDVFLILPEKLNRDIRPLPLIDYVFERSGNKFLAGYNNNWIGSDGGQVPIMPTARIWGVQVKPNTRYRIVATVPGEGSTPRKAYAFYSALKVNSADYLVGSETYTGGSEIVIDEEITTPENCVMIALSGYSNKENFMLYDYYVPSRDDFLEIEDNVQNLDIRTGSLENAVDDLTGFEDRPLDLEWTIGYTNLSGDYVDNDFKKFIFTTHVVLDSYDKLSFSLVNVNITLPPSEGVNILLVKNGETPISLSSSTTSIICSEYKGYIAYFNQRRGDAAPPIIYATKNGINDTALMKNEIVCVGDSLTNNYPAYLSQYATGYKVVKCNMGSETSIANLCRMGGMQFVNKSPLTIPASGSTGIFPVAARWIKENGNYADLSFANISQAATTINGCTVNGIWGELAQRESSAKGLVIYNSDGTVLKTFDTIVDNFNLSNLSDVTYCKVTINNPTVNIPHFSIDGNSQDIISLCSQNGYINNSGSFVADDNFKCSDNIPLVGNSKIYADGLAVSTGYIFTRKDDGESVTLGAFSLFTAGNYTKYANSVHIVFTGQNGGYENEEDLVAQIKMSTAHLKQFIVVSTWSTRTTNKLRRLSTAAFGNRYVDLRTYMINQSVIDAIRLGLIPKNSNPKDWESLFIADGTHPNTNGNILWAVLFWNTLLDLEFVKGERK